MTRVWEFVRVITGREKGQRKTKETYTERENRLLW